MKRKRLKSYLWESLRSDNKPILRRTKYRRNHHAATSKGKVPRPSTSSSSESESTSNCSTVDNSRPMFTCQARLRKINNSGGHSSSSSSTGSIDSRVRRSSESTYSSSDVDVGKPRLGLGLGLNSSGQGLVQTPPHPLVVPVQQQGLCTSSSSTSEELDFPGRKVMRSYCSEANASSIQQQSGNNHSDLENENMSSTSFNNSVDITNIVETTDDFNPSSKSSTTTHDGQDNDIQDGDISGNDGEEFMSDMDTLLYNDAQITKKESLLLIMAHFLRFGSTQEELGSIINLLRYHLPEGTPFPTSKYIFNQHFDGVCAEPVLHAYCTDCSGYVGTSTAPCVDCGKIANHEESVAAANYFITFSIRNQIQCLLEDPSIQSKIMKGSPEFQNAKCYQELPMNGDDISVTWGSDGAAIFKSSSYSIWPLTLMINELPYPLRRKHVLMGGLWFGIGKPHFPTFLKPVIEEFNLLSSDGINWKDVDGNVSKSKVFPGALTCDSVARCQLQELMQYNGKSGCTWCHHPGKQVAKGNGYTNVYPAKLDNLPQKRDRESYIKDAQLSVDTNSVVNGIKKPSIILLLLHFNIISGFVVDYMHAVCVGVVKTLTSHWLDNTDAPYYIGNKLKDVNDKLISIRPPSEVSRLARALTNRKFWKAHEWRAWLLHYSPVVLKGVLPSIFYKHWMLLVTAMHILLYESITCNMIDHAELLLMRFVLDSEDIYGKEYITYNMHILTHIPDTVRNWGPLWSISCFAFESMNHKLGKMVSGTQFVQKQIAHKFLLCRTLPHISLNCFDGVIEIKDYFIKTINHFPLSKSLEREESGVILRGAPKLFKVTNDELHLLNSLGFTHDIVLGYYKLSFSGINVTTEEHMHKMRKRIDCFICLQDRTIAVVKRILLLCLTCNQVKLCGCKKQCFLYVSIFNTERMISSEVLGKKIYHEGLLKVKGHVKYRLCSINEFHSKCAVIRSTPEIIVSVLSNNFEFD